MQRPIALIALTLVAALAWGAAPALKPPTESAKTGYPQQPDWFKQSFLDLREDLAEATAKDRRLALYFYQEGCPYCAKLLREGLGDKQIGALARDRFDWVAIDIWGDREATSLSGETTTEKGLASGLKVQYTPTVLLLDEGGKTVLRIDGYYPPETLAAALAYVGERHEQLGQTFVDFCGARCGSAGKGRLHSEAGFLPSPLRLADNRDTSQRPLVVIFERSDCKACDELHDDTLRRPALAESLTEFDAAIVDMDAKEPIQTPDGREIPARDWAAELKIHYAPSLVFFDPVGREVFRAEAWLKPYHLRGVLDYVATGAYIRQPSFPRFLNARRQALTERGIAVDMME